jgi:ribosomal protein S18 acetylase RimI-like enzyme
MPGHAESVRLFFQELYGDSVTSAVFHPHVFTAEQAVKIAHYSGLDYYAAMFIDDRMVGYGLLRGWDEGYKIPSLGVVVSASYRGLGLGRLMINYLHSVARLRGVKTIMLKVYKSNEAAAQLYRRMGYILSDLNAQEWTGTCEVGSESSGCDCDRMVCK